MAMTAEQEENLKHKMVEAANELGGNITVDDIELRENGERYIQGMRAAKWLDKILGLEG